MTIPGAKSCGCPHPRSHAVPLNAPDEPWDHPPRDVSRRRHSSSHAIDVSLPESSAMIERIGVVLIAVLRQLPPWGRVLVLLALIAAAVWAR